MTQFRDDGHERRRIAPESIQNPCASGTHAQALGILPLRELMLYIITSFTLHLIREQVFSSTPLQTSNNLPMALEILDCDWFRSSIGMVVAIGDKFYETVPQNNLITSSQTNCIRAYLYLCYQCVAIFMLSCQEQIGSNNEHSVSCSCLSLISSFKSLRKQECCIWNASR